MGEGYVDLVVENRLDPTRRITCKALVDTGAFGLILPSAWKGRLGDLPDPSLVDLEMATRRSSSSTWSRDATGATSRSSATRCSRLANVMVDRQSHCLIAKKYYELERCAA